eukprot:Sspe_Gene.49350::Locus_26509_Transcript_3_10_Confidence_0.500_Length_391::g.49350::m.49350
MGRWCVVEVRLGGVEGRQRIRDGCNSARLGCAGGGDASEELRGDREFMTEAVMRCEGCDVKVVEQLTSRKLVRTRNVLQHHCTKVDNVPCVVPGYSACI